MKPWNYDSGELNPKDIPEDYIFQNDIIRNYLSSNRHDRKLFLIGPKGSGKTLLLRYKAFKYWEKLENSEEVVSYQASESNELVESLNFHLIPLSNKALQKLKNYNTWVHIWDFAVSLIILRRSRIGLPQELTALDTQFPVHYGLSEIVSKIVNDPKKFIFSRFFACNNDLIAKLKLIRTPFVLFIDRLDQALNEVLNNEDYKYLEDEENENLAFLVWRSAQFGLLECIYNLNTAQNSHLKIFATARTEALNVDSQLRPNILNYCTQLQYNIEELKEIFLNNIRITPQEKLLGAHHSDLFYRFFGFTEMEHIKAKDSNKKPIPEHVFHFLRRHTFERPREVVLLGKQVYEQLIAKDNFKGMDPLDKIEQVRRIVNQTSNSEILRDYLSEVVPSFKYEHLDTFSRAIQQNVILRSELLKIEGPIVNYLYRIGLIGCLINQKQEFLPASKFIHDKRERIRHVDYYFVHPAIDRKLQAIKNFNDFYNEHNIVGNGYPFIPPPPYSTKSWEGHGLDHFIPVEVAGNHNEPNGNFGFKNVKLTTLYELLFLKNTDIELAEYRDEKFENAFRILSCIADMQYLQKLKNKFGKNFPEWEQEIKDKLNSLNGRSDYSKAISGVRKEDLLTFALRLSGRIVTAGIYIFLIFDEYASIHHILKNFSFGTDQDFIEEESALKFLRRAFFIKGMKNSLPINEVDQQSVLQKLSPFEKVGLNKWWAYYRNHELLINNHLEDDHRDYLKTELFKSL